MKRIMLKLNMISRALMYTFYLIRNINRNELILGN
jgi:hypothetical protein